MGNIAHHESPLGVFDENIVGQVVDQSPQQVAFGGNGFLCLATIGNVGARTNNMLNTAIGCPKGCSCPVDQATLSLFSNPVIFLRQRGATLYYSVVFGA